MGLNTLNEEGSRKYASQNFTEKGYEILHNHTTQLIKWYMEKDRQYPFKIGMILGLPMFEYYQIVESRETLLERIKMLGMLLGKNEFRCQLGSSAEAVFKIEVKE